MHGTHQGNSVLLLFAVSTYSIHLECMGLFSCYISLTTLHSYQGLFNVACMDVRYKLTLYKNMFTFTETMFTVLHKGYMCYCGFD
jgi:hypothetical protein